MKKLASIAAVVLIAIEWALTIIPFTLSWWLCSVYRSVLAGWQVSGAKSEEKHAALKSLWGAE